jgi:large subunit ribosomal protein L4
MATLEALSELQELGLDEPNLHHISESYLRQVAHGSPLTAKKKRKSDVAMTTAKWYRQKGTGRARQGEKSNPHMYKGGRAFPPRPRLQRKGLNKHVRRSALRSAVLAHVQSGSAYLVRGGDFDGFSKTKQVAGVLSGVAAPTLVLVVNAGAGAQLASRNLPHVRLLTPERINVRDLVESQALVFAETALDSYRQLLKANNHPAAAEAPADGGEG